MKQAATRVFQFLITSRVGLWRQSGFIVALILATLLVVPVSALLVSATAPLLAPVPDWARFLGAGAAVVGGVLGIIVKIGGFLLIAWHVVYGLPLAKAKAAAHKHSDRNGREAT